jgi:anti-sigma regulatory factor (Ser/Thr protein kinase)
MHIELASEEALVNIFHYAYPSKKGDVEIVCYPVTDDRFTIEIIDSGIPFNLLSAGEPVITSDLHKRKVGGLGIFLIRKVVDNIEYRREKDKNILTLTVLKD